MNYFSVKVLPVLVLSMTSWFSMYAQEPTKLVVTKQDQYKKDEQVKKNDNKIEPLSDNKGSSKSNPMYPSQYEAEKITAPVTIAGNDTLKYLKPAIDFDEAANQKSDHKTKQLKKKKKTK